MSELYATKKLTQKQLYITTVLYFALSLFGVFHHELWLDEAHHWLLARDSTSLDNLILNTRSEGHPILWNLLLFFITRITSDPLWMQIFHGILATIAVYIFLKNAPFKIFHKILFIFGYYMLFEYNLLSRNYILGILFLFAACSIYSHRKEKMPLLFVLLALASNSHAMFMVLSLVIVCMILLEHIQQQGFTFNGKVIISLGIFGIGLIVALYQIIPSSGNVVIESAQKIPLTERGSKSIIGFFKGVIALPDFRTVNFWNSNLLINTSKSISSILGILSLSIPFFLFFKNKLVLLYAYLSMAGIFLFFYITQLSAARYQGLFFLILIVGLWIDRYYISQEIRFSRWFSFLPLEKMKPKLILSLLVIQCITGITAYSMDIARPFTNAKQTIAYLKSEGLDTKIIATKACDGTALSAYLERPIFFTSYNAYCSYCVWGDPTKVSAPSKEMVLQSLNQLLQSQSESLIFISYQPLFPIDSFAWNTMEKGIHYRFLQKFENSILRKGNYYIYEMVLP